MSSVVATRVCASISFSCGCITLACMYAFPKWRNPASVKHVCFCMTAFVRRAASPELYS